MLFTVAANTIVNINPLGLVPTAVREPGKVVIARITVQIVVTVCLHVVSKERLTTPRTLTVWLSFIPLALSAGVLIL
jgi:hypothetical protein